MSMPKFPDLPDGYTINDSIAQVLTSIAMEELGLSHIINAEGEKLQYILGTLENSRQIQTSPTIDQILEVNESVKDMLGQISFSQMFLMGKMQAALNAYQKETPAPKVTPNAFVVGGTGTEVQFIGQSYDLPFGNPLHVAGSYVEKPSTSNFEFMIMADGTYTVSYQMAIAYQTQPTGLSLHADLVSANSGVIGTIDFPPESHILRQHSVAAQLAAGDIIRVVMRQVGADVQQISVHDHAISFTRTA